MVKSKRRGREPLFCWLVEGWCALHTFGRACTAQRGRWRRRQNSLTASTASTTVTSASVASTVTTPTTIVFVATVFCLALFQYLVRPTSLPRSGAEGLSTSRHRLPASITVDSTSSVSIVSSIVSIASSFAVTYSAVTASATASFTNTFTNSVTTSSFAAAGPVALVSVTICNNLQ